MGNDDRKRFGDTIRAMMGKTYTGTAKDANGNPVKWKCRVNNNAEFEIDVEQNGKTTRRTIGRKNRKEWVKIAKSLAKGQDSDIDWKEVESEERDGLGV